MSIDRIILHFAQREKAPVQVEDVVAHIRSLHVTDEIYFFDVKLKTEVLKGKIDHWSYPLSESGPERSAADINPADSLSEDWKRLVQCKELLHVADADHLRVHTFEAAESLLNDIAVPVDVVNEHAFEAV